MNNEKIFLYMISAAALCFCLFNILQFPFELQQNGANRRNHYIH